MRKSSVVFQLVILLLASAAPLSAQTSTWVFVGPDGHLHYQTDSQGNQIMDFSFAGYKAGGVSLPNVAAQQTVSPSGGDDTAAIQAAIDAVSALAPDANGFRGAVLLTPGAFNCGGALNIRTSGVVLRGSGSGSNGTVINMTGNPHTAFNVSGAGSYQTTGSSAAMTDSYVPSGAMSFNVDNPSGFNVGDTILIRRPVTSAWISFMGMDLLVSSAGQPQTWLSAGSTITTDRIITAVNGNQITLDAPLTDSFDSSVLNPPGGTIIHYTFAGRISQVGVEHLSVIAPPLNVDISQPQFTGLTMGAVMDGWAQDITFQDTQNTVTINGNVKQATLENIDVTHTLNHTGDRMADFGVSGTQIFIDRSSSTGNPGEWPFVTQGRVTGPNALLNFFSTQQAGVSAHQRWATGLLADNAQLPNAPNGYNGGTTGISYSDRGNHGSGQGWAMGWGVAWNVTTPWLVVQMPPGSQNWCIGCVGTPISGNEPGSTRPVPDGIYDSLGTLVTPTSLYLAQLCERLGPTALTNIGYDTSFCVSQGGGLPPGWSDTDVGTPGLAGGATFSSGTFTVNGGGADIWGRSDNFNYASKSVSGNVTITARVASQQNTNAWAKSGVMIRESAAANSSFVHVFVTPGHGVNMQYRASTGASAAQLGQVAGPVAPYWVRLARSGNTFTGSTSADGVTWTPVGTISVTMVSGAQAGLSVTAHNDTALNSSTFDNVIIPAAAAGPLDGATEIFPSYTVQNRTGRPLDQVYGTYIDPNDGATLHYLDQRPRRRAADRSL